ncbi:uncharacterized protein LOC112905755 [Agrilus planipennis]|uniref:Uncharacterized protein LOC112905755 n=1 Tax=Agrilus planipennis TaxID=224129 RepID=A0A7F5RF29_AGRPL|nr:uncharacterized protein LOC112905755 [Agrilus planipennis]
MATLGDIFKIKNNIASSKLKAVKALHWVAYGKEAEPRRTRKGLREFSGFKLDKNSEEYLERVSEVRERVEPADLISICHILDLNDEGGTETLVDRVCSFLNDLRVGGKETDEEENSEEEEEEEAEEEADEKETIDTFNENREKLREESKRQIQKVQDENTKRYNLRRKPKLYKKGDLVAIKRTQFGPRLKLYPKYLASYEIIKDKSNERYDVLKVGHHEGLMRTTTCAEYFKPWVENQSESESD